MNIGKIAKFNLHDKDAWEVSLIGFHTYNVEDGDENSELNQLRKALAEAEVREDILRWTAKVFLVTTMVVPQAKLTPSLIHDAISIVRQTLDELFDFLGCTPVLLEEEFLVDGNFKREKDGSLIENEWGDINITSYLGVLKDELLDALTSLIQIPTPTPKQKEEEPAND